LLPEVLDSVANNAKALEINFNEKVVQDYCSGYFTMFNSLGYIIGPLFSSQLMNSYTYAETHMIIIAIIIYYLIIYITACGFYDEVTDDDKEL